MILALFSSALFDSMIQKTLINSSWQHSQNAQISPIWWSSPLYFLIFYLCSYCSYPHASLQIWKIMFLRSYEPAHKSPQQDKTKKNLHLSTRLHSCLLGFVIIRSHLSEMWLSLEITALRYFSRTCNFCVSKFTLPRPYLFTSLTDPWSFIYIF